MKNVCTISGTRSKAGADIKGITSDLLTRKKTKIQNPEEASELDETKSNSVPTKVAKDLTEQLGEVQNLSFVFFKGQTWKNLSALTCT